MLPSIFVYIHHGFIICWLGWYIIISLFCSVSIYKFQSVFHASCPAQDCTSAVTSITGLLSFALCKYSVVSPRPIYISLPLSPSLPPSPPLPSPPLPPSLPPSLLPSPPLPPFLPPSLSALSLSLSDTM